MTTTTLVVVWCAALTVAIAIVAVQLCRCGTRREREDAKKSHVDVAFDAGLGEMHRHLRERQVKTNAYMAKIMGDDT